MAGSLTLALQSAQSGLLTTQAALGAVADNITNVNTVGYSRKIVNTETRVIDGQTAGVQLAELTRNIDEGLLKSIRIELASLNEASVQEDYFARLQELFGRPGDNVSISHTLGKLAEAFEGLTLSPERIGEQSEVVRWAEEIGFQLQALSDTVQELRLQADREIETIAFEINSLTTEIGELNTKIIRNETIGLDVTDLADKRDLALDRLAELIDIQYVYRDGGDVVVFSAGGYPLVDSEGVSFTHTSVTAVDAYTTYGQGHFDGIYVGPEVPANDITLSLQSGQLKGLVDLRDQILTDFQSQLDELASELRDTINAIHNSAVPYPGLTSAVGTKDFSPLDTAAATLALDHDIAFVILDSAGAQIDTTTFQAEVGGLTDTVDNVFAALDAWLTGNGYGTLTLTNGFATLGMNAGFNLGIVDEVQASGLGDATVDMDYNADGNVDETGLGFANFLGLNDFFIDGLTPNRYDSETKQTTYFWQPTGNVDVSFRDADTGAVETITFTGGTRYTLDDIAAAVNDPFTGISFVSAAVINDGAGSRLRLVQDDSYSMIVYDDQGLGAPDSFISALGIQESTVRASTFLQVQSDIRDDPGLISRSYVRWDASIGVGGEYVTSTGDNGVALAYAEAMQNGVTFELSGGQPGATITLSDYAAGIVSLNAQLADRNASVVDNLGALTDSLKQKSDTVRGVNLDEEMADLILYQQAYAAAARIISTVQAMFQALEEAV
ncbi:MAG: flagellar hook-associated protein FlgK [Magnetospiraceae bacterium]